MRARWLRSTPEGQQPPWAAAPWTPPRTGDPPPGPGLISLHGPPPGKLLQAPHSLPGPPHPLPCQYPVDSWAVVAWHEARQGLANILPAKLAVGPPQYYITSSYVSTKDVISSLFCRPLFSVPWKTTTPIKQPGRARLWCSCLLTPSLHPSSHLSLPSPRSTDISNGVDLCLLQYLHDSDVITMCHAY